MVIKKAWKACKDCRYSVLVRAHENEILQVRQCKFNPPTVYTAFQTDPKTGAAMPGVGTMWPIVSDDWWCWQFKPKPNGNGESEGA